MRTKIKKAKKRAINIYGFFALFFDFILRRRLSLKKISEEEFLKRVQELRHRTGQVYFVKKTDERNSDFTLSNFNEIKIAKGFGIDKIIFLIENYEDQLFKNIPGNSIDIINIKLFFEQSEYRFFKNRPRSEALIMKGKYVKYNKQKEENVFHFKILVRYQLKKEKKRKKLRIK